MLNKSLIQFLIILAFFFSSLTTEAKPPNESVIEEEYTGCYEPTLTQNVREAFPRWYEENSRAIVESIVKAHISGDWRNNKFGYIVFATKNKMVAAECVAMPGDVTKVNKELKADTYLAGCLGEVNMNGVTYLDLPKSLTTQWMRAAAEILVRSDIDFLKFNDNIEAAMRDPKFKEVLATAKFGIVLFSTIPREWTAAARALKCSQIKDSVLTVSSDGKFTLVPASTKKEVKKQHK